MSKKFNDNAFMLIRLQDKGMKLAVFTCRSLGLKGTGRLPFYENMDGIPVHRLFRNPYDTLLFPSRRLKEMLQISKELKPDLIFCSQELNMRLALILQRYLEKPIVLLVEDAGRIFSGEAYKNVYATSFIMRMLGFSKGSELWSWLCKKATVLVTCHPRDQQIFHRLSQYGKPIFYLPWPTYIPDGFQFSPQKKINRGVYVGSLYPFKNTQEFMWKLPRILKETPTKEFFVVGPGPHAAIIKKLQRKTIGTIKYLPQLPRVEALNLIASSYYGYTPVKKGGWGFIGDCWSVKTPIVMTNNDAYVSNNVNALVAEDEDALIQNINRLYKEPELYKTLQMKGYEESRARRAEIVANRLYTIFTRAIDIIN